MWGLRFSWWWILCFGRYLKILTNILKNIWVPVYQTTWYGAASQKPSLKYLTVFPLQIAQAHCSALSMSWKFLCLYMGSFTCAYIYICVYVAVDMLMRNVMWLIAVVSSWFLLIFTQWVLPEWAAGSSHVCFTIFTEHKTTLMEGESPKVKRLLRNTIILLISYTRYTKYVILCLP